MTTGATLVPKRDGDTFANDSKIDKVIPTYEYTFGGPLAKDRLWFFTAGRVQTQKSNRQLVITNIPYTFTDQIKRFEEKVTYSLNSSSRFEGAVTTVKRAQLNNTLNQSQSMDLNSLYDRKVPEDLFTLNYNGILTPRLFVEARYSQRHYSFVGDGSRFTDRPRGTLLIDPDGRRYWSATFCGVCDPEKRDSQEIFAKGTFFLSTKSGGAHSMTFGYDNFNDKRFANNHQSGSDYRIINAPDDRPRHRPLPAVHDQREHPDSMEPDFRLQPGDQLPDPFALLQRQLAGQRPPQRQPRRALGQERRRQRQRPAGGEEQRVQPAARGGVGSDLGPLDGR